MLKAIPKLRGSNALGALLNFYEDLGWNRKETLNPMRVVMNEDDWLDLLEKLIKIEPVEDRLSVGFLMINRGPSGNTNIARGKIEWKQSTTPRGLHREEQGQLVD